MICVTDFNTVLFYRYNRHTLGDVYKTQKFSKKNERVLYIF